MYKKYAHHLFWDLYSRTMRKKIETPFYAKKCVGEEFFGDKLGISYKIDLSLDEEAGTFTKYAYSVSGPTFMVAILEALGDLVAGKKVAEVAHLRGSDIFDQLNVYEVAPLYNDSDMEEYSRFLSSFVNHVIDSFGFLVEKYAPHTFTTPEALKNFEVEGEGIENFYELSKEEQIALVERVMAKDIRPYVELDDGGVNVKDITKNGIVLIEYEGNCTSCHAAGSTTLSAITSILKAKVHKTVEVLPVVN
ncbi:NifU family protein [bacterium]|nr:NifU family protein [bacterium]